ncbi:lysylphosphatidylglycerol synthase transmembrane domain-containing protein [Candidatus Leptofilum sp.]|uniref:lysylphosphatidylglycerol synthase transmembrane domain-containing protein n=1 Tax=Candidatus Leptofilum sp. TaxID=3241576 RepID=UPI003B5AD509
MSPQTNSKPKSRWRILWPWLNGGVTAVLLIGGIYYLAQTIDLADIFRAFRATDGRFIGLGLLIFIINGSLKAWRWRVLLAPDSPETIRYTAVFWAIWLGQFVNTILPFLRLGELGRAYAINQQIGISKTQAVSSMLIEKSLELIVLGLAVLLLIPFAALPPNTEQIGLLLAIVAAVFLLGMGLVTSQTERVIALLQKLTARLPQKMQHWVNRRLILGLDGLAALRHRRSLQAIGLSSIMIICLDIALPYTLFFAFALPLSLSVAVLINVAVALVTTPPTAPGELGIFEAAVFFVLAQVGQTEVLGTAVIVSYAIVFHLCTLLPKLILGGVAAVQTNWSWQRLNSDF